MGLINTVFLIDQQEWPGVVSTYAFCKLSKSPQEKRVFGGTNVSEYNEIKQ